MTKNWKLIAAGNGMHVPEGELEKVAPSLSALEAAFRPLVATIPLEIEPAIILSEAAVDPR